jgi:hypothetical protein
MVALKHQGVPITVCKVKDINEHGLSVWTGSLKYRPNTLLEVELTVVNNDGGKKERVKEKALVIHCSADSMGMMFAGGSDRVLSVIQSIMEVEKGEAGLLESPVLPSRRRVV